MPEVHDNLSTLFFALLPDLFDPLPQGCWVVTINLDFTLECFKALDPEVVETVRASSRLYQDTARQLLASLKLFSFTMEHTST